MSSAEILEKIEALPDEQRRWLVETLRKMVDDDQVDWARFSATQLAGAYAPEDSVYDEE